MSSLVKANLPCPSCPSSDAYSEYDDGHGYCFSCEKYFRGNKELTTDDFSYEYYPHRGITRETMQFYDVKAKVQGDGTPLSVGFVWPNNSIQVRSLSAKDFRTIRNEEGKGTEGLFGRDKFSAGAHKFVTITEGAYDALSLFQALGGHPVVAVQSASSAVRDCTVDIDWLSAYDRVYLCFDSDAKGREAASRVAKLLDPNRCYLVQLTKRKDPNEYLQHGEADELKKIWWNSKRYLPENIISSISDFKKIISESPREGAKYPFPTLTEMTYGIRPGESVLITAQEGVGKTEFMHAVEYELLANTDWNIGAIYLEEPKRRHLQAIAGIHLEKPVHLPDSGVTEDEIMVALEEVLGVDERLFLYSHFGSDDPESLADTIRFLVVGCGCRCILLDHITMAVSGLAGEDERKALDWLSTRLEMLVKELDFSLIVVSHVNDEGQTRGSRYIGKVADIRIDLVRDVRAGDNTTYVSISKNRFCGRTGPAGTLQFDGKKYLLEENLYVHTEVQDRVQVEG